MKRLRTFKIEDYVYLELLKHGDNNATQGLRNVIRFLKQKEPKKEFNKFKKENG